MENLKPLSPQTLIQQGKCCGRGCQNCPYLDEHGQRHVAETTTLNLPFLEFLKHNPLKQWHDFEKSLAQAFLSQSGELLQ